MANPFAESTLDVHDNDAPHQMTCSHCLKLVDVIDPYRGHKIKRASAWFDRHTDQCGNVCMMSMQTAIHRRSLPQCVGTTA